MSAFGLPVYICFVKPCSRIITGTGSISKRSFNSAGIKHTNRKRLHASIHPILYEEGSDERSGTAQPI